MRVAPISSGATSCTERAKKERRRRGGRPMADLMPGFRSNFCVLPATVSRHSKVSHTSALATPRFGHRLPRHQWRGRHCKALDDFKVLLPDRLLKKTRAGINRRTLYGAGARVLYG